MSRTDVERLQDIPSAVHDCRVIRKVINNNCDIESFFGAAPLEMFSDLLLSVQQLSYEFRNEVVVESRIFLLVLQFLDVPSERIKSIVHCFLFGLNQ